MPSPSDYENEADFVSACIRERQHENEGEEVEQSAAACYSVWREKKGGKTVIRKTHDAAIIGNEYILSDRSVDRYGDVVDSDGWVLDNFKRNPVSLFNHNSDFPIGRWKNLGVRDGALRGHLELAPKGTSPRIDEIRALVEAGILQAVSVGFMPLESGPRTKGGNHYTRQELVECSLVAIPANANALAVAKSLRVSDETVSLVFAKQGAEGLVTRNRGSNGKSAETVPTNARTKKMVPNSISQRIQEQEQRIAKTREELDTHLKNVDDANPTEEDLTITKSLTEQIEKFTASRDTLKAAESKMVVATVAANTEAKANGNGSTQAMTVATARPFAFPVKKVQPMDHLCRALTVALKHHDQKGQFTLDQVLRNTYGENEQSEVTRVILGQMVSKAASIPADTTTTGWAVELVQTVIGEFIAGLMPLSIYPKLAAKGGSFTFGRNGTISLPARNTATTIAGSFFAQGAPIPVRQGAFTAITLTPKKLGVITTLTREITEHSTPSIEGIVRQAILEDTAVAIDSILIDANPATTTRPAGLKNGVAKTTPTAGSGIAAVIGDLRALIGALIVNTRGNLRAPTWIMNPADSLAISLAPAVAGGGEFPFMDEVSAGTLMGYSLITSSTCPVDTMFLIDAADFVTATGDSPRFDVSDQAVLHMEDTSPAQIGSSVGTVATVAVPTRSLWQTDTIGIRMIMDLNWAMRRTGSVVWTDTMTWN
jgi:HK97 family phage prohead protease/HK97 family phage major capsid protein